jgi:four helix bundle protein
MNKNVIQEIIINLNVNLIYTAMHNFRNLKIWQESIVLAEKIYIVTSQFPETEKYGLTNQMRRCSVSIPSNIAEGSSRTSEKEFKHFLSISLGSAFELFTQLELANRLGMVDRNQTTEISELIGITERKISAFMKQLQ